MILLFVGDIGHLWYVKAMVVSVILLFICLRMRFGFTIVLVIAAIFDCFGLILEPYHGLLLPYADLPIIQLTEKTVQTIFGTVKNGFAFGFLLVSLGAMRFSLTTTLTFSECLQKRNREYGFSVLGFLLFCSCFYSLWRFIC